MKISDISEGNSTEESAELNDATHFKPQDFDFFIPDNVYKKEETITPQKAQIKSSNNNLASNSNPNPNSNKIIKPGISIDDMMA